MSTLHSLSSLLHLLPLSSLSLSLPLSPPLPPSQEFIQKDPSQTVKILDCLIKQPSKADLLAPLFHPNNSPAHFLEMYSNVETVAREEGPNVAFSVLTKVWEKKKSERENSCVGLVGEKIIILRQKYYTGICKCRNMYIYINSVLEYGNLGANNLQLGDY